MSSAGSSAGSSSGAAAAKAPVYSNHGEQLRSHLQARPLKFQLKAGNAKWACTLIHKNELERQRAARTNSSTSTSSEASSSSASSVGSHH